MKKLLLFISALTSNILLNAQSFEIYDGSSGNQITNNQVITEDVAVGNQSHIYFYIKNTSSNSVTYGLKRVDNILNANAEAYFCFGGLGTCFPPSTTISPSTDYLTVAAGANSGNQQLYFDENGPTEGYSEIMYEIYNVNDANDKLTFTFKFNPLLSSVKESASLFTSASNIFPNPSSQNANIKIHASSLVKGVNISLTNTLGTTVYNGSTTLNAGDNTVRFDTENLVSGIYFATISYGKHKIVKKFIVNK